MTTVIEIDPLTRSVQFGQKKIKLPNYSFQLLRALGEKTPEPVSFDTIENQVWGGQVSRDTLKQRIRLLRQELAKIGVPETAVEAARSIGYRLTVKTVVIQSVSPEANIVAVRRLLPVPAAIAACLVAFAALTWLMPGPASVKPDAPVRIAVIDEGAAGTATSVDTSLWFDINRRLAGQLSRLQGVNALATVSRDTIEATRMQDIAKLLVADMIVSTALVERGGEMKISYHLIDGVSEEILWSDEYRFTEDGAANSVGHFVRNVAPVLSRQGVVRRKEAVSQFDELALAAYFEALELSRQPGRDNLAAAIARLDAALRREPSFAPARGLRAQFTADLVMRHGASSDLAVDALHDARAAVAQEPANAELKYALARAELATGNRTAALAQLQGIVQYLPYVERDIAALQ